MIACSRENLCASAFVLGIFAVAYNVAVALHEAGHAFAMVLDGGHVQEFVLNPFSWSWCLGRDITHPMFTAWGGVTFGLVFALVPLAALFKVRARSLRAALWILGGTAFLMNGVYLVAGVAAGFGDGGELVARGAAPVPVAALGVLYILAALGIWALAQPLLGLGSGVRFPRRLGVLLVAIVPYLALIVLYNALRNIAELPLWAGLASAGVLATLLFAITGQAWAQRSGSVPNEGAGAGRLPPAGTVVTPKEVALVNAFALAIIGAELVIFGFRDAPF